MCTNVSALRSPVSRPPDFSLLFSLSLSFSPPYLSPSLCSPPSLSSFAQLEPPLPTIYRSNHQHCRQRDGRTGAHSQQSSRHLEAALQCHCQLYGPGRGGGGSLRLFPRHFLPFPLFFHLSSLFQPLLQLIALHFFLSFFLFSLFFMYRRATKFWPSTPLTPSRRLLALCRKLSQPFRGAVLHLTYHFDLALLILLFLTSLLFSIVLAHLLNAYPATYKEPAAGVVPEICI